MSIYLSIYFSLNVIMENMDAYWLSNKVLRPSFPHQLPGLFLAILIANQVWVIAHNSSYTSNFEVYHSVDADISSLPHQPSAQERLFLPVKDDRFDHHPDQVRFELGVDSSGHRVDQFDQEYMGCIQNMSTMGGLNK